MNIISYQAGMSNGYFVTAPEGVIAVDTGCLEGEDVVLDQCAAAGIRPEDIKLIVLTHGHVDHFFNLPAMKAVTGAPILCHESAAHFLINGELPDVDLIGRTPSGCAILKRQAEEGSPCDTAPKAVPDILINGEYPLNQWGIAGKLIPTPGHSKGCISVVLDSGDAIVGDLFAAEAGSDRGGMPYFTYPGARFEEAQESVQKLLDLGVHTFYSGHGGPFARSFVAQCLADERAQ